MLGQWGLEGARCFYRTELVLSKVGFGGHNDGGNKSSTNPITFTCGTWSIDLCYGVHEDPIVLRCSIWDGLFSIVKIVSSREEWSVFVTHMKKFCRSKICFSNSRISIFQKHKIQRQTNLYVMQKILLQLCYMLIFCLRFSCLNQWFFSRVSLSKKKNWRYFPGI